MTFGASGESRKTQQHSNTVAVAMSGGVDSSVAAMLALTQGQRVIGVHLRMAVSKAGVSGGEEEAACVCRHLGIPFEILDVSERFRQLVIARFAKDYAAGRTPNPCAVCNPTVKFAALMDAMVKTGADQIATGHYAAIVHREGIPLVARPTDRRKDQTYFLFGLNRQVREHLAFPLAGLTKAGARSMALAAGLPVADRPESQDICFVPDGDYRGFLFRYGMTQSAVPGNVVDLDGRVLCQHQGIHRFTVGQRRGLGFAQGRPLYVLRIEPETHLVVVGDRDQTMACEALVRDCAWAINPPDEPLRASVMIRYQDRGHEARIVSCGDGRVLVRFDTPVSSITPGQAAVFYQDDAIIGGGFLADIDQKSVMG